MKPEYTCTKSAIFNFQGLLLTAACFLVRVQLKELITVALVASWRVFAHMHTITGWVTFIHV